jgi:hypothetical protein
LKIWANGVYLEKKNQKSIQTYKTFNWLSVNKKHILAICIGWRPYK